MDNNWIGLAALTVSVAVAVVGFVSRPAFVPAARAQELRVQIRELQDAIQILREENEKLEFRAKQLIGEVEFWRDEYRRIRGEHSA